MRHDQMQSELNYPNLYCHTDLNLETFKVSAIRITISHPFRDIQYIDGFSHLWAIYVKGFNPKFHCQKAFRGRLSQRVKTRSTPLNKVLIFGESKSYDSLYICGVAAGPASERYLRNLHLALEFRPGERFTERTYNGFELHIENGLKLSIPELPKGWGGLPDSYTRCCNFRFCAHRFGYQG